MTGALSQRCGLLAFLPWAMQGRSVGAHDEDERPGSRIAVRMVIVVVLNRVVSGNVQQPRVSPACLSPSFPTSQPVSSSANCSDYATLSSKWVMRPRRRRRDTGTGIYAIRTRSCDRGRGLLSAPSTRENDSENFKSWSMSADPADSK